MTNMSPNQNVLYDARRELFGDAQRLIDALVVPQGGAREQSLLWVDEEPTQCDTAYVDLDASEYAVSEDVHAVIRMYRARNEDKAPYIDMLNALHNALIRIGSVSARVTLETLKKLLEITIVLDAWCAMWVERTGKRIQESFHEFETFHIDTHTRLDRTYRTRTIEVTPPSNLPTGDLTGGMPAQRTPARKEVSNTRDQVAKPEAVHGSYLHFAMAVAREVYATLRYGHVDRK